MDKKSKSYLDAYLAGLSPEIRRNYTSFSSDCFCADEYNANACAELVRKGKKTASCGMEYWYIHEKEPIPAAGHLQVVTNWNGDPVCIIELTSVSTCKFKDVTPEFAYAEGEGDRSLEWWREAHWKFFAEECKESGIDPSEEMVLVLERFKVVHR